MGKYHIRLLRLLHKCVMVAYSTSLCAFCWVINTLNRLSMVAGNFSSSFNYFRAKNRLKSRLSLLGHAVACKQITQKSYFKIEFTESLNICPATKEIKNRLSPYMTVASYIH